MGTIFSTDDEDNHQEFHPSFSIIYIEGNIGSGKTTLLDDLEKDGFCVIREDVNTWKFLSLRYKDPERWTCTFQTEIALSLYTKLKQAVLKAKKIGLSIIFVERSILTCLMFANLNLRQGSLSIEEFNVLTTLCTQLHEPFTCFKHKTVLLECDNETCLKRIILRNRPGETIDIDYLEEVESICDKINKSPDTILIDSTQSPQNIKAEFIVKLEKYLYI